MSKTVVNVLRRSGPGKYESGYVVDEYIHQVSSYGSDEEAGDVTEVGEWAGLLRGAIDPEPEQIAEHELTPYEVRYLKHLRGAIVFEGSQGFVTVEHHTNKRDLAKRWRSVVKRLERD